MYCDRMYRAQSGGVWKMGSTAFRVPLIQISLESIQGIRAPAMGKWSKIKHMLSFCMRALAWALCSMPSDSKMFTSLDSTVILSATITLGSRRRPFYPGAGSWYAYSWNGCRLMDR